MLRLLRPRRRDEKGATLILTAVSASAAVIFAGFAVDLGVQRVSRRDMQAIADLVALDLSRELDGGKPADYGAAATFREAIVESVHRNTDRTSSLPVCVYSGTATVAWQCTTAQTGSVGVPPTLSVELGALNADGVFIGLAATSAEPVTAVRVNSSSEVGFHFVPGSGAVGRNAVAVQGSTACYRLGSFAAGLNSQDSALLNPLIGSALGVGVLGYDGLATANVTLLGLASELGLGTVHELLTTDISVARLLDATADVLNRESNGTAAANVNLLNQIVSLGVGGLPPLRLREMLSVDPDGSAALQTTMNVLDLVKATAFIASGGHFVAVPSLSASALGVSTVSLTDLHIVEGVQQACGKKNTAASKTETSQVNLDVRTSFPGTSSLLNLVGLNVVKGDVNIHLDLAKATGQLTDTVCGAPSATQPDRLTVDVATGVVSAGLSTTLELNGTVSATSSNFGSSILTQLANLLGITLTQFLMGNPRLIFDVDAAGSTSIGGIGSATPTTVNIEDPATTSKTITGPVTTGSDLRLNGLGSSSVSLSGTVRLVTDSILLVLPAQDRTLDLSDPAISHLLGFLSSTLNTTVPNALNPLITNVNDLIMGPIAALTGLNLAGADLFALGRPTCDAPTLRG